MVRLPTKMPPKAKKNVFKMTQPEVALNLQPDGFKVPPRKVRQHKRF